ncbi:MAG: MerR family transcriptional regulator, partial [Lachnospiraceae bacterium]|nr:MerR family transcriptional regulator [Lachnospiraceae bacterium]
MDDKRYTISDAATMTELETHVLRYWEDELDIH